MFFTADQIVGVDVFKTDKPAIDRSLRIPF
jgi:hypothetical protein